MEETCAENDSLENEEDELDYEEIIDQNHLEIVTNLDVEQRHFVLSYLRSKAIIDEEDCEIIRTLGNTRQQKVSILLDTIKRRGKAAHKHFIHALEYEHPVLYQKCTGKNATSVMVPIPTFSTNVCSGINGGLPGKELIDLERTVLSKQLEQTSGGLHTLTRSLYMVQEEKNSLEKKLMEAVQKMQQQEQHIVSLKELMAKNTTCQNINVNENHSDESDAFIQAQQIQMMNHQQFIIMLQSNLLRQTEDIDKLKKENVFYKETNMSLKKEVDNLNLRCDSEKRNSMRLNQKVLNQHGELQQVDHFKKKNLELRKKIGELLQEKEEVQEELEEFRKYSEVLNTRYTMLTEEKIQLKEHREEISSSYQSAQERINELTMKLNNVQCDNDYLHRTNDRLQSDVKTYRELQKTLHEERERLRHDCREAWSALEETNEMMIKSKRQHDESIHSQMIINYSLDNKYRDLTEELDDLRLCLRQTNEELVRTKKSLGSTRSKSSFLSINEGDRTTYQDTPKTDVKESKETLFSQAIRARQGEKNSGDKKSLDGVKVNEKCDSGESDQKHTLKRRANKEVLDSIRRKLSQTESDVITIKSQSLPKGLMTFNQLHLLYSNALPLNPQMYYNLPNQKSNDSIDDDEDDEDGDDGDGISSSSDRYKSPLFQAKAKEIFNSKVNGTLKKQMLSSTGKAHLKYVRAASVDDTAHRKKLVDIEKNTSNDSVFEQDIPAPVRFSSKNDCEAPCLLHSTSYSRSGKLSLTFKNDADDALGELENVEAFRKRSFVIGAEYNNRRRSVSAPTSPIFKC